ncbi:MAG: hypothetical protein OER95_04150, partial [Acidimicrobiia bacterium]|nr:hypothetical protein [Acidimicrobiia bacterium]
MLDRVPPLTPKQPGLAVRAAGVLSDAVRLVIDQIEPYTLWWDRQNQLALAGDGSLLVAIGDSTAVGIGASHPGNGYIGRLTAGLDRATSDAKP